MGLSHLDRRGRAKMVDVSGKPPTLREAVAEGVVKMLPRTQALIREGAMPKGDVFAVARLAGIMAAKRTGQTIPLCHPLSLTFADVELAFEGDDTVRLRSVVRTDAKTGVEMEALHAVAVAGLTIYDMCKAVDRGMRIEGVRLLKKTGGKSDYRIEPAPPQTARATTRKKRKT
ncbi:MAG: cyclic pyranopterin monophosphate synthase MoaC [Candidatus Wallbacteria bacterium]|nr:cyclic pyranopterin monophosphate synthase MoaC [Candidatus Wallbacteria bacterium]